MTPKVHKTFLDAFQKLTIREQEKIAKTIEYIGSGQLTRGMRIHKVANYLSFSSDLDLRIIAAGPKESPTLMYVDHHDAAYKWVENRKFVPTECGTEILPAQPCEKAISDNTTASNLFPVMLDKIASLAKNEEQLLEWIVELSPEWQEWMFKTYIEKINPLPQPPKTSSFTYSPIGDQSLAEALSLSFSNWLFFLHPTQSSIVQDNRNNSIAVLGDAGTGKTVVLLRRLYDSDPPSGTKQIFLTYSKGLCSYFKSKFEDIKGKLSPNKDMLPLFFLTQEPDDTRNVDFHPLLNKIRLDIEQGQLYYLDLRSKRKYPVDELLVDEIQDISERAISILAALIQAGKTRVVIAGDLSQTIHRANFNKIENLCGLCQQTYNLTYSYRASKQILTTAKNITNELARQLDVPVHQTSVSPTFALSGVRVTAFEADDLTDQVKISDEIITDLENRYDHNGLSLIYLQYYNPAFKGKSDEETELKDHSHLGQYYQFASVTKGKEFVAGVIFISKTFLSRNMGVNANQLRINTLYVALTRFRDQVVIVYPKGCAIEGALKLLQVAL